jgi:hypothetical protein
MRADEVFERFVERECAGRRLREVREMRGQHEGLMMS